MKKGVEVHGIFIAEKRYDLLQNVVNHLIEMGYRTEDGSKIEDDESFKSLQKTAEDQVKQPYFVFCFDKYPSVGLLHKGLLDGIKPVWEELPFIFKWILMYHVRRIKKSIHKIDNWDKARIPFYLNKMRVVSNDGEKN